MRKKYWISLEIKRSELYERTHTRSILLCETRLTLHYLLFQILLKYGDSFRNWYYIFKHVVLHSAYILVVLHYGTICLIRATDVKTDERRVGVYIGVYIMDIMMYNSNDGVMSDSKHCQIRILLVTLYSMIVIPRLVTVHRRK